MGNVVQGSNRKQQNISRASYDFLFIAKCILEDIAIHLKGMDDITVSFMAIGNDPAFEFESSNAQQLENYFDSLVSSRVDIPFRFDASTKIIKFNTAQEIAVFIPRYLAAQHESLDPVAAKIEKPVSKEVSDLTPEDLLILKRQSFLNAADLSREFVEAQKLVGIAHYMHFRFTPNNLEGAMTALGYTVHGIKKYDPDSVFRLH